MDYLMPKPPLKKDSGGTKLSIVGGGEVKLHTFTHRINLKVNGNSTTRIWICLLPYNRAPPLG